MSVPGRRDRRICLAGSALVLATALAACAPQRPYRAPLPPSRTPIPQSRPLPAPTPPPAPPETVSKPLPPDPKIREQDLKPTAPPVLPPSAKEPERRPAPDSAVAPPPLADDSSLLAKITPGVSPQRAASLRLTDEGRKLLDAGEPAKALDPS